MMGITLLRAPQNWQVIQQQGGYGSFTVEAEVQTDSDAPYQVMARVCEEATGESVTGWTRMERTEKTRFCSVISGIPTGGPYRLETSLVPLGDPKTHKYKRGDARCHLYVGDVYVIAGQSNAAGRGRRPVFDPPEDGVHVFRNSGIWDLASHPLHDCTDTVFPESAEKLNPGHSPWLEFGRVVKRSAGVPVGLIPAAKGGTPLSAWNPCEDGYLYHSMMDRIHATGGCVRGVLWYQGCADAESAETAQTYGRRFTEMAECLRRGT